MCSYEREMPNKRYQPNKSNGGIVPQCKDERLKYIKVPCGHCIDCRKEKANQ